MKIERENSHGHDINMIVVSREEALSLIHSLSNQLLEGNGNSGRVEHYTDSGEYVSISVDDILANGKNLFWRK